MKASTIAVLCFALGLFLTAIAWPQTISGTYVGIDFDKVGTQNNVSPDGKLDNHIKVTGVKTATIAKVTITDDGIGVWEHPYNGVNWEIDVEQTGAILDLWFAQFNVSKSFAVKVTYSDGSVDQASVTVSSIVIAGLIGQIPVTTNQTLCSSLYVNPDFTVTIAYWADTAPCTTLINKPLLNITRGSTSTICTSRVGNAFDLWESRVLPCVHP